MKSVNDVGIEVERPAVVGDEVGAAEEADGDGFGAADEAEDDGFGAADEAEDDGFGAADEAEDDGFGAADEAGDDINGFGCSSDFLGRRMNRAQDGDVVLGASVVEGEVDKSEV
jgi:hypothetical protein